MPNRLNKATEGPEVRSFSVSNKLSRLNGAETLAGFAIGGSGLVSTVSGECGSGCF